MDAADCRRCAKPPHPLETDDEGAGVSYGTGWRRQEPAGNRPESDSKTSSAVPLPFSKTLWLVCRYLSAASVMSRGVWLICPLAVSRGAWLICPWAVSQGVWLICPRGRLPIILGPRRGQNGAKMSDLGSNMEPKWVQNRSRRTSEIDEKPW